MDVNLGDNVFIMYQADLEAKHDNQNIALNNTWIIKRARVEYIILPNKLAYTLLTGKTIRGKYACRVRGIDDGDLHLVGCDQIFSTQEEVLEAVQKELDTDEGQSLQK